MKNTVGSPVYGENFRFRQKNLRKAIRYLKNSNSFMKLGIRRTGKSSFLKQTAHLLRNQDETSLCIELDCQPFRDLFEFYKGLYIEMPKDVQTRFKKFLGDSKRLPTKLLDAITDMFDSVEIAGTKVDFHDKLLSYSKPFEELVTAFFKESENVYLFLDELPFFFENMGKEPQHIAEIKQILTSLRSWRNAGLAMGITGSLNLHQQLDHLGISRKLLAGLNTIELDPFSREESRLFIQELHQYEPNDWWTDEIAERLLSLLPDYIPYFLQYAYNDVVVHECKNREEVEEVFHNEIMPGLFRDFIYQFDERLGVFKDGELASAMNILDTIALSGPVHLEDIQAKTGDSFNYEVLVKLIDYEFIRLSGMQAYSFTLKIIQNWWITKRGLKK